MNARRIRHDLHHLVSWLLLVLALTAIATGILADTWDLNDFRWHRWAGYAMAVAALAHVAFTWRRLVAYTQFRVRRLSGRPVHPQGATGTPSLHPPAPVGWRPGSRVTRRGLLWGLAGTGAGVLIGRGLRPTPVIPGGEDLGYVYHEWSKPGRFEAFEAVVSWGGKPAMTTSHPDAPRFVLPDGAAGMRDLTVVDALHSRASVRSYAGASMPLASLAALLALADGLRPGEANRRTAPSAGALYPIEVYAVVHDVESLSPGVYHYDPHDHALELLGPGDRRQNVVATGLHQDFLGSANVTIYLTLVFQRLRWKYRDRTYRYGLLEAGHIGQNVYLAAESLGLGACAVGAFLDDQVNAMLGVDGREEAAVYLLSVGTV